MNLCRFSVQQTFFFPSPVVIGNFTEGIEFKIIDQKRESFFDKLFYDFLDQSKRFPTSRRSDDQKSSEKVYKVDPAISGFPLITIFIGYVNWVWGIYSFFRLPESFVFIIKRVILSLVSVIHHLKKMHGSRNGKKKSEAVHARRAIKQTNFRSFQITR